MDFHSQLISLPKESLSETEYQIQWALVSSAGATLMSVSINAPRTSAPLYSERQIYCHINDTMLSTTKSLERQLSNTNTKQCLNVGCQTLPNTNYRNQNIIACQTVTIKYLANGSTVWLLRKTNICRSGVSEGREDQTERVVNERSGTVAVPPPPPRRNLYRSCEEGWGLTISLLCCFQGLTLAPEVATWSAAETGNKQPNR